MEYVYAAVTIASAAYGGATQYQASKESADLSSATAEYDALIQERQARIASRNADLQTSVNLATLKQQQDQQEKDASSLERHAEAQRSQGRETVRRARLDAKRLQARQRARIAGSGLTAEGTPLDILAETAGDIQLSLNDQKYAADVGATSTLQRANIARRGADQTGFSASLLQLDRLADTTRTRAQLRNAELTRLGGDSRAAGFNNAATAALITGATNTASAIDTSYERGVFTSK